MEEYKRDRLASTLAFYSSPIFYRTLSQLPLDLINIMSSSSSSVFTSPLVESPIMPTYPAVPIESAFMLSPNEIASLEMGPLRMSHPYDGSRQAFVGNLGPFPEHNAHDKRMVSR